MRGAALLLLLSCLAIAAAGCAGSGKTPTPGAVALRREDLVAVTRALKTTTSSVSREVAATKTAWPLVVNGLPAGSTTAARAPVQAAARSAAVVRSPALLEKAQAASLTGPAAELAGLFQIYSGLSKRGWQLIAAAIAQIEHGSTAGSRFARENVALYIDSVYDGHFDLAQIGKHLRDGYRALGGPTAFGTHLTEAEVDALTRTYSEATDRLHPHVGVRLGS